MFRSGGRVVAIVTESDKTISSQADYSIMIPKTIECFDSLITSIPLQFMAYHIAVCKGLDVNRLIGNGRVINTII